MDDEHYTSLTEFKPINDSIKETIEQIEEEVAFANEQMDFKIEFDQIKFFGTDIDYDMMYNFDSIVVALIVTLIQEIIGAGG